MIAGVLIRCISRSIDTRHQQEYREDLLAGVSSIECVSRGCVERVLRGCVERVC